MITGTVNTLLEPVVTIAVRGPAGIAERVDVVVDTGYTGKLTLPRSVVNALNLPLTGEIRVELADGSEVVCDVHLIQIEWDGKVFEVYCEAADTDAFLGTALLEGFKLAVDFRPGGSVTIAPLP